VAEVSASGEGTARDPVEALAWTMVVADDPAVAADVKHRDELAAAATPEIKAAAEKRKQEIEKEIAATRS
jgi:hypothetical protein